MIRVQARPRMERWLVVPTPTIDAQRGEILNLDAAGEYVRIDNLYSNPTNVTLSAWVNFSACPSTAAK